EFCPVPPFIPLPVHGHQIQLPPLQNPALGRVPLNVHIPRGIHSLSTVPVPVPIPAPGTGPVATPGPIAAPSAVPVRSSPVRPSTTRPSPARDEMDIETTTSDSTNINAYPNLETKPYNLLITFEWTNMVQPHSGSHGRASKEVKSSDMKLINLNLGRITRPQLVRAMYSAHQMQDDFMISNISSPQIKVQWKGKGTGTVKNYLCTVETNDEWGRVCDLILEMDPSNTPVSITYHADDIRRFHKSIQLRLRSEPDDGFDEVGRVNGGPQASLYNMDCACVDNQDQRVDNQIQLKVPDLQVLQGKTLQDLKKNWLCNTHSGEHGEPGYCFIAGDGEHIHLNMHRRKIWVAAIHANRASLEIPPNVPEFKGNTSPATSRSRRATSHLSSSNRGTGNQAALNDEFGTVISSIIGPLTAGLVGAFSANMGQVPSALAAPAAPVVPPMALAPASESAGPSIWTPSSIPNASTRDLISVSVAAFHKHSGLNISNRQDYLVQHKITPDLVSCVPFDNLANNLGIPGGHVLRYQMFCDE
ncbi:hypothetical protein FRC07_002735, partial [Ceratobasidium sp. 392]